MQRWQKLQEAHRFLGYLRLAQWLATWIGADVGVWAYPERVLGYSYGRLLSNTPRPERLVAILRP